MKRFLTILGLIGCLVSLRAEPLRIVSYNVENLFHPKHDTISVDSTTFIEKDDYEWTPDGERRWSYTRYYRKVENIARVLTNIGEWDGVDIVGLQEVENALCVKRLCYTLRPGEYDFVHYESPDPRGIDVALIYKKARIDTIATRAIRVSASLNDGMSAAKPLNGGMIEYGKGVKLRDGKDVAVLTIGAIGNTMAEAIEAVSHQPSALSFAHYDMRWLKPLDEEILHEVGKHFKTIVTAEDGMIAGGLGSAVLEWMADHGYTPRVIRLGVNDQFVEHGSTKELYHMLKLDKEGLCESLLQVPVK